jgi:hypothetical protein
LPCNIRTFPFALRLLILSAYKPLSHHLKVYGKFFSVFSIACCFSPSRSVAFSMT